MRLFGVRYAQRAFRVMHKITNINTNLYSSQTFTDDGDPHDFSRIIYDMKGRNKNELETSPKSKLSCKMKL